jgi:hypothetical protein
MAPTAFAPPAASFKRPIKTASPTASAHTLASSGRGASGRVLSLHGLDSAFLHAYPAARFYGTHPHMALRRRSTCRRAGATQNLVPAS